MVTPEVPWKFPGAGESAKVKSIGQRTNRLINSLEVPLPFTKSTLLPCRQQESIRNNWKWRNWRRQNKAFALIHGASSVGMLFILNHWKSIRYWRFLNYCIPGWYRLEEGTTELVSSGYSIIISGLKKNDLSIVEDQIPSKIAKGWEFHELWNTFIPHL